MTAEVSAFRRRAGASPRDRVRSDPQRPLQLAHPPFGRFLPLRTPGLLEQFDGHVERGALEEAFATALHPGVGILDPSIGIPRPGATFRSPPRRSRKRAPPAPLRVLPQLACHKHVELALAVDERRRAANGGTPASFVVHRSARWPGRAGPAADACSACCAPVSSTMTRPATRSCTAAGHENRIGRRSAAWTREATLGASPKISALSAPSSPTTTHPLSIPTRTASSEPPGFPAQAPRSTPRWPGRSPGRRGPPASASSSLAVGHPK